MSRMRASISLTAVSLMLVVVLCTPAISQTPRAGGTLNITQREDLPQGFAIHETQTSSTVLLSMPCFNNLLVYDPTKKAESLDTIVEYVKNPDYFVKGRPYLDGLKYVVIVERGTRTAALQSGAVDVAFPGETSKTQSEQLKKAVPQLVVTPISENVNNNIIMNIKKPPFDNLKVRLAVSHAIDRRALIQAVYQGGGVIGAAMAPKPHACWGLAEKDLAGLPGYGQAAEEKAKAKKMMAEVGYSPD